MINKFLADHGMLVILAALCVFLTVWTIDEQHPGGASAGEQVADSVIARTSAGARVVIIARDGIEDDAFADALAERLLASGRVVAVRVNGQPRQAVETLQKLASEQATIDAIAVTKEVDDWAIFDHFDTRYPLWKDVPRLKAMSYYWSTFLTSSNLLNIANQIAVIAIMAIGMTMVIIAGGIDLSVGSLLALSAVISALLIRVAAGAYDAEALGMVLCCVASVLACAVIGFLQGTLVSVFGVPAFIVTLGGMLIARGIAGKLTGGQSVYDLPDSFTWLGRDSSLGLLPNAVVLMGLLYVAAHLVMSQTVAGRYIYAVGGNREAARLSGVPVERVTIAVYVVAATLAGVGGVILASQLKSGSPTYGNMYELYVIAAVVVGGTSLSGGEGKILGTLIGAFLIAVINNGMNLLGLRSFDQLIVLGVVFILSVLLDRMKQLGWLRHRRRASADARSSGEEAPIFTRQT